MDIKNTAEVLILGCQGFEAYQLAMKDGKLDAADILYVVPLIQAIEPAIKDINLVPAEMLDLDANEMDQLLALVMEKVPSLKTKAETLIRIKAVAKLLIAAKECYVAFTKPPSLVGVNAIAANSFESPVSEGEIKAALRADTKAADANLEAAVSRRDMIAAERAKAAAPAAAEAPKVAEAVAEAKAAGDSLAAREPAPGE